jgi:hypothetical protein
MWSSIQVEFNQTMDLLHVGGAMQIQISNGSIQSGLKVDSDADWRVVLSVKEIWSTEELISGGKLHPASHRYRCHWDLFVIQCSIMYPCSHLWVWQEFFFHSLPLSKFLFSPINSNKTFHNAYIYGQDTFHTLSRNCIMKWYTDKCFKLLSYNTLFRVLMWNITFHCFH